MAHEGIKVDSLTACVAEVASRYATPLSLSALDQLPKAPDGRLPWHQAEAALETANANFELQTPSRLPKKEGVYPALVELEDEQFVLVLDCKASDLLVWDPETAEENWRSYDEFAPAYVGRLYSLFANPDVQREGEAPWHAKSRAHWFWSELRKERRSFRPV